MAKIFLSFCFFVGGAGILSISLVKLGWDRAMAQNLGDELREIPVNAGCYKFPETRVLPGDLTYGIKLVRDQIWWWYTEDAISKVKMANLLADKRMMEAVRLADKDSSDGHVLEAAKEATGWLAEAEFQLTKVKGNPDEVRQLKAKLKEARLVYKDILLSLSERCPNGLKYQELADKLSRLNEENIYAKNKFSKAENI